MTAAAPTISYIAGYLILGAEIDDGSGSEFVFHLPDALGSTRDVVDSSGNVIRSFEHDEYGNLISSWSSGTGAATPKTWIGGLSVNDDTADSGMFNMGHRNYAGGVLGRFISRDPIGHAGNLNLYAYPTNPVNAIDPAGLDQTYLTYGRNIDIEGTYAERKKIVEYLDKINGTDFGEALIARIQNRCDREQFKLTIAAAPIETGTKSIVRASDQKTIDGGRINVVLDPNHSSYGKFLTSAGVRRNFPLIALGHELGHVLKKHPSDFRTFDDNGPNSLFNVAAVENPLRAALGRPLRLEYYEGTYDPVLFNLAQLEAFGISDSINSIVTNACSFGR